MLTRILLSLALGGLLVARPRSIRAPPTRTRSSSRWTPSAPRSWTRSWTRARRTLTITRRSGTRWSDSTSTTAASAPVSPSAGSRPPTARAGPSICARGFASTTAPRADRPRRAGLGARRVDPRPDHEPPQRSSGAAGAQLFAGRPQPGHRALHRPSHRGHVPRPHRGARRDRAALPKPAPSVHEGALLGGATGRPGRAARRHDSERRGAVAHRSAFGLSLPPALSSCDGAVLAGGARDQSGCAWPSRVLPPVLRRRRQAESLRASLTGSPQRACD